MNDTAVRTIPVWAPFAFAVTAYGALLLYRLFLSPLSKIPGPWVTRISGIPEANALKDKRRTDWVNSLFVENPGAVAVRTGPNSVSFNHPDAVKAIYGRSIVLSGCLRFANCRNRPWQRFRGVRQVELV